MQALRNRPMTASHVDALVCSAFNRFAAEEPSVRKLHPNGMMPCDAAKLANCVRKGWVESYFVRINKFTPQQQQKEGFLFTATEVAEVLAKFF